MNCVPFPHCCTAKIITDFGQSPVAAGGPHHQTVGTVEEFIKKQITSYYHSGLAMFVATTNSQQVAANKALRNLGFKSSPWISKTQHPETKVRLWWRSNDAEKQIEDGTKDTNK